MISFKDPAHVERALDDLRRAGLPSSPNFYGYIIIHNAFQC
jgi:hypothetical protein